MINLAFDSRMKHVALENALRSRLVVIRRALIEANQLTLYSGFDSLYGTLEELEAERACIRVMLGLSTFPLSRLKPTRGHEPRW